MDGNTSGYYEHRTTSHTRFNKDNWWQVDLGASYPIHLVIIHHRMDRCCRHRINGAKVYAGKELCGTIQYIPYRTVYPINCSGKNARVVKVVLKRDYLQLAEVQVYGIGFPSGGNGGVWAHNTGEWKILKPSTKIQNIPGGPLRLGTVFVIRGKHLHAKKQWVINFYAGKHVRHKMMLLCFCEGL